MGGRAKSDRCGPNYCKELNGGKNMGWKKCQANSHSAKKAQIWSINGNCKGNFHSFLMQSRCAVSFHMHIVYDGWNFLQNSMLLYIHRITLITIVIHHSRVCHGMQVKKSVGFHCTPCQHNIHDLIYCLIWRAVDPNQITWYNVDWLDFCKEKKTPSFW